MLSHDGVAQTWLCRETGQKAHLLLGDFVLQRFELPVLLFGDQDPPMLNIGHRLHTAETMSEAGASIQ